MAGVITPKLLAKQITAAQAAARGHATEQGPTAPNLLAAEECLISGGGKLSGDHYYRVHVAAPISPEVPPYIAECADIIEALNMTFNEGEAFKALWRLAASRQGRGKPGNAAKYDADKAAHYGARVAVHSPKLVE